eukprot:TRINITY_DN4177_c0_g1_i1.p1 TRINITY_DN4177_c0_g1~~TRINITY_DN4177_c0_g1_i1.p1  ORF type:complete len:324 (+),score=58.35 TRINITY_DN4177_c0_g1_i1:91-1062(+)
MAPEHGERGGVQTVVPFIRGFSKRVQLFVMIGLVLSTSLLWGYFQELFWKRRKFPYGVFVTWFQCLAYVVFANVHAALAGVSVRRTVPVWFYLVVAAATFGTRVFGNFAYRYLNYTCKVMFMSALPLPTMLLGAVILRKSIVPQRLTSCLLLITGLAMFSAADSSVAAFDMRGAMLMVGSLLCDSAKYVLNETALVSYHAPELEVSLWSSMAGGCLVLPVLLFSNELVPAVSLCLSDLSLLASLLLMLFFGYITSLMILSLTSLSGDSYTSTVVTGLRKAINISMSFFFFPKPFLLGHAIGGTIFFVGLAGNVVFKHAKKRHE